MRRASFIRSAAVLAAAGVLQPSRLLGFSGEAAGDVWMELIRYARWCPSPHNVQPWRMKIISARAAHLYYDPARVPAAVDPDTSFTIAGMGMFIECLDIAARPLGYRVTATHAPEPVLRTDGNEPGIFAQLRLAESAGVVPAQRHLILQRRTSRRRYDGRPVPADACSALAAIAAASGHRFEATADPQLIHDIIHLDTATILSRANDEPAMAEMRRWIRTTDAEAAGRADGLWSRANATSGRLMHNFFYHHQRFSHGWKLNATRRMLSNAMEGTATMAWISGPFAQRADWVAAGSMLQRLWLELTAQGLYMQPLGTIITTPEAKARFLELTHTATRAGSVWLLVRIGHSDEPVRSFRLPVTQLLMA